MVGRGAKMRTVIYNECGKEVVPTYESLSAAVKITAKDSVVGMEPGRAEIFARVGNVTIASTMISVVPNGRVSMVLFDSHPYRLATFDLDGSNLVEIPHNLTLDAPVMDWSRDRTQLAISGWNGGSPTTYFRSGNEPFRRLVPEPVSPNLYGPVFSPDGTYVYAYHAHIGAI